MKKYYLQNLHENKTFSFVVEDPDKLYATALNMLGYTLNTDIDDGEVHEYVLFEKETKEYVGTIVEYMHERACFEAISMLNYFVDDEVYIPEVKKEEEVIEDEEDDEEESPENILRFPLLGSKFGTNE